MDNVVDQLFANIEAGRQGRNIGISTGLPVIDSTIYGIQRKYLYTIGADTSG
jgi:replicative DNA helicase